MLKIIDVEQVFEIECGFPIVSLVINGSIEK